MAATIGVRSIRGQNRSLESLSTCGLSAVSRADTESSATRLFLGKSEVYAKRVPLRTLLRKSPRRGFRSAAFWTPRENRWVLLWQQLITLHYPFAACQAAESFVTGRNDALSSILALILQNAVQSCLSPREGSAPLLFRTWLSAR